MTIRRHQPILPKSIPRFRTAPPDRTTIRATTYERSALQRNNLRCRPRGSGFDVAEHGLLQLRIHFVCDSDYIEQDLAEIHSPQIVLKGVKDTDLQDSRFFHHHSGGVALFSPQTSMLACGDGDVGFRRCRKPQAVNHLSEEMGKVTGAVLKAQRDTSELLVVLNEFHPVLNRRIEVMFQYGCHALRGQRPMG